MQLKKIVELEHKMIQAYWNAYGKENSYNHYCNGKFSMAGLHHSEEIKQKLSEERKGENNPRYGRHLTDEQKQHLKSFTGEKASMYGKHFSEEHKLKISKALKGRTFSKETREKISKANKGKHMSEEAKQKIKLANTGKIFSEEHKDKIRQKHIGTKKKMYEFVDPFGNTHIIDRGNATKWHPDWVEIKTIEST